MLVIPNIQKVNRIDIIYKNLTYREGRRPQKCWNIFLKAFSKCFGFKVGIYNLSSKINMRYINITVKSTP